MVHLLPEGDCIQCFRYGTSPSIVQHRVHPLSAHDPPFTDDGHVSAVATLTTVEVHLQFFGAGPSIIAAESLGVRLGGISPSQARRTAASRVGSQWHTSGVARQILMILRR